MRDKHSTYALVGVWYTLPLLLHTSGSGSPYNDQLQMA